MYVGSYQPNVSGSVPVPQRDIGKPRSIGLTILLTIVTFGIWSLLWRFWTGEELKRYRVDGLGGGIFLLFAFLIYPAVMFLMADEVANSTRKRVCQPRSQRSGDSGFFWPSSDTSSGMCACNAPSTNSG